MEITAKEREMLEKERDETKRLTLEIVELSNDPNNRSKIKQNVLSVQCSVNRIASYADSKNYKLDGLADMANILLEMLSGNPPKDLQKTIDETLMNPPEELRKKLESKGYNRKPLLNVDYPIWWSFVVNGLNIYCCCVNSIRFDFTKKGLKIVLPKIKNLNLGFITNR
jgi:hypothetical protein